MPVPRPSVLSVVAILCVTVLASPSAAIQIAQEAFRPSFPHYANGGSGFAAPWEQGGFNAFASGYTPRPRSLCYQGIQGQGGSVSGHAFPAINGAVRDLTSPLGLDNTTVYVSFLVQPRGILHDGQFNGFFGLTLNGTGIDLFVGKSGGGALEHYVLETRGGFGQVTSGVPVVVGTTALLVVKAQFRAGADEFTLYANPAPNQPEPGSSVVKNDLDLGTVTGIGIYSTGAFTIDEIRIGTAYADVIPPRGVAPDPDFPGCLVEPQ